MIDKELKKFVKESLKEDIQSGDQTSLACIDSKNNSSAILLAKDNGIIAGVELAIYIFNEVDNKIILCISNFFINFIFLNIKKINSNPVTNTTNNPAIPAVVKIWK